MPNGLGIFVSRIVAKYSFGPHQCVLADVRRAKAAGERSNALSGETHDHRNGLVDKLESRFILPYGNGGKLDGMRAEKVSGGVDAIDSHVIERPTSTGDAFNDANIVI